MVKSLIFVLLVAQLCMSVSATCQMNCGRKFTDNVNYCESKGSSDAICNAKATTLMVACLKRCSMGWFSRRWIIRKFLSLADEYNNTMKHNSIPNIWQLNMCLTQLPTIMNVFILFNLFLNDDLRRRKGLNICFALLNKKCFPVKLICLIFCLANAMLSWYFFFPIEKYM